MNETGIIKGALARNGLNISEASRRIGVPNSTLCGYIKDPARMPLGVLQALTRITGMDEADARELMGVKKWKTRN